VTAAPLVSVRNLRVRYAERRRWRGARGRTPAAVEDVSLDIERGTTLALVGESGCGKTTTARALLRLIEPEAGELRFDGADVLALHGEPLRRHRRRMQMVFQDPFTSLDPRLSVGDAIAEGLRAHALADGEAARTRVAQVLAEVELSEGDAARYPHELSGGQRQRVAIARALALDPEFLVLDEAVSALDVTTQARVLALFSRLAATRGLTVMFIAHNLAVVQQVADSVAVMYRGRVVEHATAARLFTAPRHPYTQALLSAVPVPDPAVRPHRIMLPDDSVAGPPAPDGCPFFPRCPHASKDAACLAAVPSLTRAGVDHHVACVKAR
jgi:oligopeptide/dipeptide ABC transporter ATP-binding protein